MNTLPTTGDVQPLGLILQHLAANPEHKLTFTRGETPAGTIYRTQ